MEDGDQFEHERQVHSKHMRYDSLIIEQIFRKVFYISFLRFGKLLTLSVKNFNDCLTMRYANDRYKYLNLQKFIRNKTFCNFSTLRNFLKGTVNVRVNFENKKVSRSVLNTISKILQSLDGDCVRFHNLDIDNSHVLSKIVQS